METNLVPVLYLHTLRHTLLLRADSDSDSDCHPSCLDSAIGLATDETRRAEGDSLVVADWGSLVAGSSGCCSLVDEEEGGSFVGLDSLDFAMGSPGFLG